MSELTDIEIIEKIRSGDLDAFEEIVKRYQDRVFRYLYSRLGNYDEALDASQDVFVQVMESIHSFRGESKFSTWLYSVTANYCRNHRRKQSRAVIVPLFRIIDGEEVEIPLSDERDGIESRLVEKEMMEAMIEEMGNLPDDYFQILTLRDIEGLPYEDIARITGISLSNVKVRIHRGREMLKKRLAKRGLL
ncbi:MAG: RNA polymerase sigma factor [Spirochaetota bacterium]